MPLDEVYFKINKQEYSSNEAHLITEGEKVISVRVAETADDLKMVLAVRAAVFLGEEGGNYHDWMDRNDQFATHVLAFVGRDPVATIRLRRFADFAMMERVLVLKKHRSLAVSRRLVAGAIAICRTLGYRRIIGHVRLNSIKFWERQGGRVVGEPQESPHGTWVPMALEFPDAATHGIAPYRAADIGLPEFELRLGGYEMRGVPGLSNAV